MTRQMFYFGISKPVGSNKAAMVKLSHQAEKVNPAVQAVSSPIASVSSTNHARPSIGTDFITARLAFNAAGGAMFTHPSTTHVSSVARYRSSREHC
jgi:hypothetical protein